MRASSRGSRVVRSSRTDHANEVDASSAEENSGSGSEFQCENTANNGATPVICITVTDSDDSNDEEANSTVQISKNRKRTVCNKRASNNAVAIRLNHKSRQADRAGQFMCPYTACVKPYADKNTLKYHLNAVHAKELLFPCPKCPMRFYRTDIRKKHLIRQHGEGNIYCCYICKRTSVTRQEMHRHMSCKHFRQPRLNCPFPLCSGKSFTRGGLAGHMRRKHSSRTFCCYLCETTFTDSRSLRQHIGWVHCGQKSHKCPKANCAKMFKEKNGLRAHMAFRHGEGHLYTCRICKKSLASAASRGNHMRFMHSGQRRFKCPLPTCSHKTFTKLSLRDHMAYRHGQGQMILCQLCEKPFSKQKTLDAHIKHIHSGEPLFRCTIRKCSQKFHQNHILKEHMAIVHGKGSTFCCYLCKIPFCLKTKLTRHMNCFHIRQIRFKCTFPSCSVEYGRKDHLQRHLKLKHGKAPTLTCDACKQSFANLKLLGNHKKVMHSIREHFICLVCDNVYSHKQSLKKHMERVHSGQSKA